MINIKKIKIALEDNIIKQHELQFPFTQADFNIFARELASTLANQNSVSWIKNLEYMRDYILAPLMISSKEVIIGIIILNEVKPIINPTDILESNNYLSQINSTNPIAKKDNEWKCDLLVGILAINENKLSSGMKSYIMNCRGYLPQVLITRMPKKITAMNFVPKQKA